LLDFAISSSDGEADLMTVEQETIAGDARPPRRWRRPRATLLLAGFLAVFLGGGFLCFVGMLPVTEAPPARNADGIVVLTGAALRINDALALLAEGRGRRLLITGVNPSTRSREIASLMPEHRRWFECCVDLDHSATNTIGNAIETRRWATTQGFKSLIVVTSNFHMPRAMAELGHQLPDAVLVPYPVISEKVPVESWWTSHATTRLLFSEYLKFIAARARIWLEL
jgi:uncharacterized SAM-binding protein YcdF (DUF218 family)